ncbi:MAG: cyclic di-AMP binding protein CbpA [Bacillus sp. (in: Bacteria)]|nr:cyclic di-AMP binding protein CbpA [Bacillus sp. (in: firmicutes)]
MKIKYNIIPKEQVRFITENFTIKEAVDELEDSGYRCIPVLDETASFFKGNIYIQDIYRAILKETHQWENSVMDLVDDREVFINEQASFFSVFSSIKKYPYLAVINDDNVFTGILTHANVMSILEDSWGVKTGSYTLNISTHEYKGALSIIVSTIKKHTGIQSLLTLDNDSKLFRRVLVTLPTDTSEKVLKAVTSDLEEEGLRVFEIEKI